MALDFSIEPFFDDFSEDDKYHKILFRPGYAVQARELTQLQTILQEQIRRHGDHIFKEGAMVIPGQIAYDLNYNYVTLTFSAGANVESILSKLVGLEIKNSSGLSAIVMNYTLPEGDDPATIFVKYLNSVQDPATGNNISTFDVAESLAPTGNPELAVTVAGETATTVIPIGKGCAATIQRGIYYIKKKFVLVTEQTVILDKYTNSPSYRVGLQFNESVIYPEDNEQLLDNALGSPNYAAPGAARHYVDLVLTKLSLTSETSTDFIDLLRLQNGNVIFKIDRTNYAEIEKTLARRTYDESGDYALDPFNIQAKEYRNNLRGDWAPGEKFIQGDLIKISDGGLGFWYFVAVKSGVTGNTRPSVSFSSAANGSADYVDDNGVRWEYSRYPNFNQGLVTFTSGSSEYANFTLNDHIHLNGMVTHGVEAGKAYVRGYEIEKLATQFLNAYKSRNVPQGSNALAKYLGLASSTDTVTTVPAVVDSISSTKTATFDMSMGSYVVVNNTAYLPDIVTFGKTNLHCVTKALSHYGGTLAGVAITGTSGQFSCTAGLALYIGQRITITGTAAGTGSITAYTTGTQYVIIETNGSTTFRIATLSGTAVTTTAGTPTGLTYTVTGTGVGTARVRAFEKHLSSNTNYKTFLFDISMNAGFSFAQTKCIATNNSTEFKADIILDSGIAVLNNPSQSSLIYKLPDYAVSEISSTEYIVVVQLPQLNSTAGATPTLSYNNTAFGGMTFESGLDDDNYIVINSGTGAIVTPTTIATTSSTLTISGGLVANTPYKVLATMKRVGTSNIQHTRAITDATQSINTQIDAQTNVITLEQSFVSRIVSVRMSNQAWGTASPTYTTDITNRYLFDAGQRDTHLASSTLTLDPSAALPTGPIQIKYEYVNKTSSIKSSFNAVGTYTHSASNMTYDQIPSVSGQPLRDSIDFRPYQSGSTPTFTEQYLPKYGSTGSFGYKNYLSRIDDISLSSTGNYIISRGIPGTSSGPRVPNDCMKLARITYEPYTFTNDQKLGVVIDRAENKRYTMRDIGKLERRIQDLEYYTALSLTELETKNMRIVDSTGLDRYQNGFLVDSFDGQGVGNASSDDWNASIDSKNKELRPFFSQKQVSLLENVSAVDRSYKVSGDLVTLPYTEEVLIAQNAVSTTEFLNPYNLHSYRGIVSINPWSDTWFSTHYRPDIILNDEGQYNAIVAKAEADGILGTVWNNWQVNFSSTKSLSTRLQNLGQWSQADTTILSSANNGGTFWRDRSTFTAEELDFIGNTDRNIWGDQAWSVAGSRVITIETSAVETKSTRAGTRSFIVDKVDSRIADDRVVETQIVPFIRPRSVLFTGFGFKPNTKMYAFFDNIPVDSYIESCTRVKITPIIKTGTTYYPFRFDTERNAGSAVSNAERTVYYSDGIPVTGTMTFTNGSATVEGLGSSFTSQISVGDTIVVDAAQRYEVLSITDNDTLVLKTPYTGVTANSANISIKVIKPNNMTSEVEVAFNHGEVIKEYVNNVATGRSAIVVGQELFEGQYYIYVLNIKGPDNQFSTVAGAELRGEYTGAGEIPRVKFVEKYAPVAGVTSTFTGQVLGIFKIPSNPILKFRTGTRELRFSDSASTDSAGRAATESTSGSTMYQANGLVEIMQRTIISTRTADIVSQQVSDEQTIVTTNERLTRDTGWFDPLAQTFLVQQENGAFLTSVDLFFSARDPNLKIPCRIEIREVVNGYPGAKVLPFSRVEMKATDVNLSTTDAAGNTSLVATTFKFSSPVFVQNGVEYALVALSDSDSYKIWISQTDQTDVLTKQKILSQPYNGVLFKSQNASAWTADQTQDMKFVIRRAKFTQSPKTIEFIPPKLGYTNLRFNPFNFITGSGKCRVEHPNHGMVVGNKVVFLSRQIIDSISGISADVIFRSAGHEIISAELDSYVVDFSVNSTSTGKVGGGYIAASENYEFQTAMLEVGEIVPASCSVSYQVKSIPHSSSYSVTSTPVLYDITPKENRDFDATQVYPSEINYPSVAFPSRLSVIATLNPGSTDSISPVIDLSRIALTMVSNKVDSPDYLINDFTLDAFPISSGNTSIGDGSAIELPTIDGYPTMLVNSTSQPTLFTNLNNNLSAGDMIRFVYVGITDATRYAIISDKSRDGAGNLYLTLEALDSSKPIIPASQVALTWMSHFKSEYASIGGSTHSKYVTKKINFSRTSDMLRIMFSALIPNEAEVEIYYKTGNSVDGDFIASRYYRMLPSSYSKSSTEFSEVVASAEGLDLFDSVIIKLVMKSTNKAKVPRIQDFRVIACAA
jgi:hypothetical protein